MIPFLSYLEMRLPNGFFNKFAVPAVLDENWKFLSKGKQKNTNNADVQKLDKINTNYSKRLFDSKWWKNDFKISHLHNGCKGSGSL